MTQWDPYEPFAQQFTELSKEQQHDYVGRRLLGLACPPTLNAPQGEQPEDFVIWLSERLRKHHAQQAQWLDQAVCDALDHFQEQIEAGHKDREQPYLRACRTAVHAELPKAKDRMVSQLVTDDSLSDFARGVSGPLRTELIALLALVLNSPDFWPRLWDERGTLGTDPSALLEAVAAHCPKHVTTMICEYLAADLAPPEDSALERRRAAAHLAAATEHALRQGVNPLSEPAVQQMARSLLEANKTVPGRMLFEETCQLLDYSQSTDDMDLEGIVGDFQHTLADAISARRQAQSMRRVLQERLARCKDPAEIYACGSAGRRW